MLDGNDVLAQAQTGTGKTAAFALPILSRCDMQVKMPQALVVAPTRELAIQVAQAFQSYAKHLPDFHVTPIYGGQDYRTQFKSLDRGPQVIVGTPGRILDHLSRGTLIVEQLKTIVLDEADEMLKMGFVEDIEAILEQLPTPRQTGLFSATMPAPIQKIAKRYLKEAKKIKIAVSHAAAKAIEQSYICLARHHKGEVLRRYLEIEDVSAAIVFVRTKIATVEVADKLRASGYAVEALNGDLNQARREKVIGRFKKGSLDLVVATDVAARGIDVERVSHVINYDIPTDVESYIHRIGRTGRAGRQGRAMLFVTPREKRLLHDIEREISVAIDRVDPPTVEEMSVRRLNALANSVNNIVEKSKRLAPYQEMVVNLIENNNIDVHDIAAALAYMLQQSNPLPDEDIASVGWDDHQPKQRRRRRGNRHPAERRAAARRGKSGQDGKSSRSGKFDRPRDSARSSGSDSSGRSRDADRRGKSDGAGKSGRPSGAGKSRKKKSRKKS